MNELDGFFSYLLSPKIERDLKLIIEYPDYKATIKRYKAMFEDSMQRTVLIYGKLSDQMYSLPYNLFGGSKYELKINVNILSNIINNRDSPLNYNKNDYIDEFKLKVANCNDNLLDMKFSKDFLNMIIDENNVDKEYARTCINKEEPVICGDFTGLTPNSIPFFIIDGNHKAYGKIEAGIDNINGILVGRNVWINALVTEKDKMFIKIFSNINFILSYRSGILGKEDMKKFMYSL